MSVGELQNHSTAGEPTSATERHREDTDRERSSSQRTERATRPTKSVVDDDDVRLRAIALATTTGRRAGVELRALAPHQPIPNGPPGRLSTTLLQMARVWLAVFLSLALVGVACSGGGEESTGALSTNEAGDVPRPVEPFADVLGCDSWSHAVSDGRLASAVGYACVVDGSQVAWVHTFQPSDRRFLFEHFEQRSPNDNLDGIRCADGQRPPETGPWILVGDRWAVSSYHEDPVAQVEEALGGEYAGGGGDGEAPPTGPPASFQVPDFCADG